MTSNNFDFFCGIDISKDKLDCTFIDNNKNKIYYSKIPNNEQGIRKMLRYAKKYNIQLDKSIFCCKNTGNYTLCLANLLHELGYSLWIENTISISKSLELNRGKNDLIDSFRIAKYALRYIDKCVLWSPSSKSIQKMEHLFSLRDMLQKTITLLTVPLKESKNVTDKKFHNKLENLNASSINSLKESLEKVDRELELTISEDGD